MSQRSTGSAISTHAELQQLDQVDEWVIVKIVPKTNNIDTVVDVRLQPRPKNLSHWN